MAVELMREAANAGSYFAPYLNAVPVVRPPLTTLSFETFPSEYLHLLHNEAMVRGWAAAGPVSGGGSGG